METSFIPETAQPPVSEANLMRLTTEDRRPRRRREAVQVYEWKDNQTDATGWVVLATICNGVSGGGIFMHSLATKQEVADIAFNMARKFTACAPQIGGAKAGIRFDHTDPRAHAVLRRFIIAHATLLKNTWVTAGDLNTDDAFIERTIQEEIGLVTCQATLGRLFAQATKTADRSPNLAKLIGTPATPYFPLIEGTVGYGMAASVRWAVDHTMELKDAAVAIQGFGAVGSGLVLYLYNQGIKVVAISDKDGYYVRPGGINVPALLEFRKQAGSANPSDPNIAKNLCCALDAAKQLATNRALCTTNGALYSESHPVFEWTKRPADNEEFLCTMLREARANIVCPCAGRYQISKTVIDCLAETGCRWLISGANNPFGNGRQEQPELENLCFEKGISVVPDWVANSGTAQLFHRGLSVDLDMRSPRLAENVLEVCATPIRTFLDLAYLLAEGSPLHLAMGCRKLASQRLAEPIPFVQDRIPNRANSRYALPPLAQLPPLEQRLQLCKEVGLEIVSVEELEQLLKDCPNPVCYDGFEPSGSMHIAQGLMKAINVNRLTAAGFTYIFWIADWFAKLNLKFDGDLDKIRIVGKYFVEVWRASGMNMDRVVFLWCADELNAHSDEYWGLALDIATSFTVKRVERCGQIMGRGDKNLQASQIFYPCMQATDIFFLGVDVCQLGLDQRKVNMLAREYADKKGITKPVILSHRMLPGLKQAKAKVTEGEDAAIDRAIAGKMSKSDPSSAVFMEDSPEEVEQKINSAFCPATVEGNPCLAYFEFIIFPKFGSVEVGSKQGPVIFQNFAELAERYVEGSMDFEHVKAGLVKYLNLALEPVRQHFAAGPAKALLDQVRAFRAASQKK